MLGMVVVFIIVMNFLTCLVGRMVRNGELVIKTGINGRVYENNGSEGKAIIVAGMLNQATEAFREVMVPMRRMCYLNYSMFGYDPRAAGMQIRSLTGKNDVLIGVSIGAKAMAYATSWWWRRSENGMGVKAERMILVNPCTQERTLKPRFRWLVKVLAPVAEVVSYALGWLAVLPVIPSGGGKYSLALLVDQLFWMGCGKPDEYDREHRSPWVILSEEDEFLDNSELEKMYGRVGARAEEMFEGATGERVTMILTRHAFMTGASARKYERAIDGTIAGMG